MCYIFGLNCCLQEIKIVKSDMDLWEKDSSSKSRAANSGKTFLRVITHYVEVILFQQLGEA